MGFGTEKRNLDEIDRSNFGTFSKRNLDEIDRSDFDRFAKRRQMEATNDESQRLAATTSWDVNVQLIAFYTHEDTRDIEGMSVTILNNFN